MLSLLSRHGRATPLVWLTVDKAALKNRRNGYEYQVLVRLAEILPADVRVRVVADRGFGDHKLYRVLTDASTVRRPCFRNTKPGRSSDTGTTSLQSPIREVR